MSCEKRQRERGMKEKHRTVKTMFGQKRGMVENEREDENKRKRKVIVVCGLNNS